MKTKCIYALFILTLFSSFNLVATERRAVNRASMTTAYPENRFVNRFSNPAPPSPSSADEGIVPGDGERPDTDTALNPIGDAVWLLSLFGLVYGVSLFIRNRAKQMNSEGEVHN
ncbi:MAG: hypothetical protein EZS26_001210 [Candidatus Ordinivivax streblomastigis]|uniref:Uncharacterized protein n=1 Tax=Candidatus Ordinivivax streblomastigis TaxID=2540710 RepID=A0A5M8P2M5_9BACT|nr:MAG: hypothetical protein EZS26_001210 [Candidatus Ordinivivax streblomastigis]